MRIIWDFWSGFYEKLWVQKYSLKPTRNKVIDIVRRVRKDGMSVLDIGCGTAQLLRELDKNFGSSLELYGIDYSARMLREASKKPEYKSGRFRLKKLDVEHIARIKRKFDIISCCHSFPYYKNQKRAFDSIGRLVKDGGVLIMASGTVNNLYDKLVLSLVSLSTGKARYPSLKDYKSYSSEDLKVVKAYTIRERIYMPSINVLLYKKSKCNDKI